MGVERDRAFELGLEPEHASAWNGLGCAFRLRGEIWLAIHHFEKATLCDPNCFEALNNLGDAFREAKVLDGAAKAYARALTLRPRSPLSLANLAAVYRERGLLDLAIETYEAALKIQPAFPDAICNLAGALYDRGSIDRAIELYVEALELKPDHADALNNLANALREKGRVVEASELYLKALRARPDFAAARANYASLLQILDRKTEALEHYAEAVRLRPDFAEAYGNMGNALREAGDAVAAAQCYAEAVRIDPSLADAHCNLAALYRDAGDVSAAAERYAIALKYKPDSPDAFCGLVHCCRIFCDWKDYEERIERLVAIVTLQLATTRLPSVHPHHAMLYPLSSEARKSIATRYAEAATRKIALTGVSKRYDFPKFLTSRLRVGYVSGDFGDHPTSHLMRSVPGAHDRSAVEVFCYALSPDDGSVYRASIVEEAENFVDLSDYSDADAADKIFADGIHILVDMNGHTKGARSEIFALRPAPVRAMWLGYPGTSGSDFIDYFIADQITVPLDLADQFSEKIAHLPKSCYVGDHERSFPHLKERTILREDPDRSPLRPNAVVNPTPFESLSPVSKGSVTSRCQYGLPENAMVYCNFNQLYKIDPVAFALWVDVLKSVPGSVLWLLRFPPCGESNLRLEAARAGLNEDRIIFSDVAPKEEHVRRGQLADVCLDTLHCNGHTTNLDVLWAGTPVVTLPGQTFASRVGASQLMALGCPELIATSTEDYRDIAVKLGTDEQYLREVRAKVWQRRLKSSLFDCQKYVQDLESIFFKMWGKYLNGDNPSHIQAEK